MLELFAQFSGPPADPPCGFLTTLLPILGVALLVIVTYAIIRHGPRIAWSVFCVLTCILLASLWVRSYFVLDSWEAPSANFDSGVGQCTFSFLNNVADQWRYVAVDVGNWSNLPSLFAFSLDTHDSVTLDFPHWFLVALLAAFSAIPWVRWRFSLRTLLIATTLVAVVLGLIVWSIR
jgi:hypothetical protein